MLDTGVRGAPFVQAQSSMLKAESRLMLLVLMMRENGIAQGA